jgi:sodium/bile acid cotransporter 7
MHWLLRSWFLVSLVVLLTTGMLWGWSTTEEMRQATFGRIDPGTTTIIILFLMSFSLNGSRLRDSFRSPGPVIWGTIVNIGIMPLLAWPLANLFGRPDFALGLMIAAVVPCTLATASVSTRQAGGNDAVSLLITMLTNLISVVLTPLWLKWTVSIEAEIDPWPVIVSLAAKVLLPTIAGQIARLLPVLGDIAVKQRYRVGIVAQCLVLLIVTKAAVEAGGRLQGQATWPTGFDFVVLAVACAGLHAAAMVIAHIGGKRMGLPRVDLIATIFAGSQKTLPVGLLVAAMPAITGGMSLPFITFPILLFHSVQLMMDSAIADEIARRGARIAAAGTIAGVPD